MKRNETDVPIAKCHNQSGEKKEVRDAESQRRFPRRMARYAQATLTTTEGMKVDLWFRETLGFRKIDGKWTITHEHSSVPFYMDGSFKAAIDLKP